MTDTWTLPPKGDISDYLDAHPDTTHDDLVRIERDAPLWTPGVDIGVTSAPEAVYAVPDCPGDVFPDSVFRWLNACAKSVGVPLEMLLSHSWRWLERWWAIVPASSSRRGSGNSLRCG